jgi:glycosyltransferase involved in cell wall biosynthesis
VCYHNALELSRRGHAVTVFTAAYPPSEYTYPPDFVVRRLPPLIRIGNAPLLPGLLGIRDFDVIHLHHPFIFGAELVGLAASIRKIPIVLTHHNDLLGDNERKILFSVYSSISLQILFKITRKFAVVSLDHALGCTYRSYFRKRILDVIEVPNGIDINRFYPQKRDPQIRRMLGIREDARVILFVGALDRAHHFKGVDVLLKAFSMITNPDAILLIVGDGDLKERYRERAKLLGVAEKTVFAGKYANEDLPPIYRTADVSVLPSFPPESFGLVLIEALACGTPVIASNLPGVRTVVRDGEDGFLVPPGDPAALAARLETLLGNPDRTRAMGEIGCRRVQACYAWPKVVERLEGVYQAVVSKHSDKQSDQSTSKEDFFRS